MFRPSPLVPRVYFPQAICNSSFLFLRRFTCCCWFPLLGSCRQGYRGYGASSSPGQLLLPTRSLPSPVLALIGRATPNCLKVIEATVFSFLYELLHAHFMENSYQPWILNCFVLLRHLFRKCCYYFIILRHVAKTSGREAAVAFSYFNG